MQCLIQRSKHLRRRFVGIQCADSYATKMNPCLLLFIRDLTSSAYCSFLLSISGNLSFKLVLLLKVTFMGAAFPVLRGIRIVRESRKKGRNRSVLTTPFSCKFVRLSCDLRFKSYYQAVALN